MKVEKKAVASFNPIVITLESKEEADKMYFILDMPLATSIIERCERKCKNFKELDEFKHALWKEFDRQHGSEW